MSSLKNIYEGKTVLITGHTGFKGSWLCLWLEQLGARVIGLSLPIPVSTPSMYDKLNLSEKFEEYLGDIRDPIFVKSTIDKVRPDFIFHLAAQPLVGVAYDSPVETFTTNAIGTVNVLNALRFVNFKVCCVCITSDKAYDNKEVVWGYREIDDIGGVDPYSASKGMAELAIRSFVGSYFNECNGKFVNIAVARAGNVIGGGDWALDRLIPDCVEAWSKNKPVTVRSIKSTRPWQHVLEPLGGYLLLGMHLSKELVDNGDAYNFGPRPDIDESVDTLLMELSKNLDGFKWHCSETDYTAKESVLLKLCCDKAKSKLNWQAQLSFSETIEMTAQWYFEFYKAENSDMYAFTIAQIRKYIEIYNREIQTYE